MTKKKAALPRVWKRFTVYRNKWNRGSPTASHLLGNGGKMCCLGFLAEQCGVPRKAIDLRGTW